jgi:hypothetical protein
MPEWSGTLPWLSAGASPILYALRRSGCQGLKRVLTLEQVFSQPCHESLLDNCWRVIKAARWLAAHGSRLPAFRSCPANHHVHELGQYISQPRDKDAALQLASSFARIKTHLRCWWTRAGDEIEWPFLPTLQAVVVKGNEGRGGDVEKGAAIDMSLAHKSRSAIVAGFRGSVRP